MEPSQPILLLLMQMIVIAQCLKLNDRSDCDKDKFKSKEKFDAESGLEVIEYKKDLDWKVAAKDTLVQNFKV